MKRVDSRRRIALTLAVSSVFGCHRQRAVEATEWDAGTTSELGSTTSSGSLVPRHGFEGGVPPSNIEPPDGPAEANPRRPILEDGGAGVFSGDSGALTYRDGSAASMPADAVGVADTGSLVQLSGTTWRIMDLGGDYDSYDFEFLPSGVLRWTYLSGQMWGQTFQNASWVQSGTYVQMVFNNGYIMRSGSRSGDAMSGVASNAKSLMWYWSGTRK